MDENHNRVLKSNFIIIERHLLSMKRELKHNGSGLDSILNPTVVDIDQETRAEALDIIMSMLAEIKVIKKAFNLAPEKKSLRKQLHGMLSEIWVILEESKPERLEGYGRMSEADKKELRPYIQRLLELLDNIYRALR